MGAALKRVALLASFLIAAAVPVVAQTIRTEHVVVYGARPDSDIGVLADKVPGLLQSFSAGQLTAQHGATVLEGGSMGGELAFTGAEYFDGDPSNRNARLPSTVAVNMRASYQFDERWQLFGLVNNLFDDHHALYGVFFDPGTTAGLVTPALTDSCTLTLRQPVSFQLGVRMKI